MVNNRLQHENKESLPAEAENRNQILICQSRKYGNHQNTQNAHIWEGENISKIEHHNGSPNQHQSSDDYYATLRQQRTIRILFRSVQIVELASHMQGEQIIMGKEIAQRIYISNALT